MGRYNQVVHRYKGYLIVPYKPESHIWCIYREADLRFVAVAKTLRDCRELINGDAIGMCELMCR